MIKSSIKHLRQNHMTYVQHFIFACGHGIGCLLAGLCLICHAMIPALFPTTGSVLVQKLNKSFTDHKTTAK